MNSNRSSNQGQGKAKGKNRSKPNKQPKKAKARPSAPLSKGSRGNGMATPSEKRNADGSRSIYFEEYVQEVAGSVGFSASTFPVQPGLPTLFAWLASQAVSYQEYEVKQLGFRFESDEPATAPGKLMMAFLQDPSDALPASKQEMLENQFKAKCKSWEECTLRVDQKTLASEALGRTRFVRTGALASNLDIKMYDLGQLIVATQGQADTSTIGELYVIYEIVLRTPIISAQTQAQATSLLITSGGTVDDTALFGSVPVLASGLSATVVGNTITFQRVGRYLIDTRVVGTGLFTSFVPVISASTAAVALVSSGGISNAAANAGTAARFSATVVVTARGQTAVFDCATQATTVTSSDARVATYSA